METIGILGLTLSARPHFVMSGDIHHYRREVEGPTLHVTAGGGGAFLHPAPIARGSMRPVIMEWPHAKQSRALLWQVPGKVALGRSGFLPHVAFLTLFAPLVLASGVPFIGSSAAILTTAIAAVLLALIGGVRQRTSVAVLAAAIATGMCGTAVLVRVALDHELSRLITNGLEPWLPPPVLARHCRLD